MAPESAMAGAVKRKPALMSRLSRESPEGLGETTRCGVNPVHRALCGGLISIGSILYASHAHAATCSSDNQAQYTKPAGTSCSIAGGTSAARISATGSGSVQANGVAVVVPFGVAVTASAGASVIFGIDSVAGGSRLSEQFAGSGGITGLLATGVGSQITASDMTINLPASGITVALAQAGGLIALNDGTAITMTSGGGSQGLVATGAGSKITADGITLQGQTGGGDIAIHSTAGSEIDLANSTVNLSSQGGGVTAVVVDQSSTFNANNSTITISGAGGNVVGVQATGASTATLSGGSVNVTGSNGSTTLLVQGQGTTLTTGNTAISIDGSQSSAATLQNGGTLAIAGGAVKAMGAGSVGFLVNGAAGIANTLQLLDTSVSSTADTFHAQGAVANIELSNTTAIDNNGVLLSVVGTSATTFGAEASTLSGAVTTESGSTNNVTLNNATTWIVTGNSTMTSLTSNASAIVLTPPTGDPTQVASYKTVTTGNYVGSGSSLTLNTFLGDDSSPSDKLIVNGGTATGTTAVTIHNTTGPGAATSANGVQIVQALNGASTASNAFTLANELRPGAFYYELFHGGLNGNNANDWYLRSSFEIEAPPPGGGGGGSSETPGEVARPGVPQGPEIVLPVDPPPQPLVPGTLYPIIGPELSTYGVVQPLARQMGLTTLGTLHERIGDTLTLQNAGNEGEGLARSAWGRIVGEQIDNRYLAYSNAGANGQLLGIQAGLDVWRGSLAAGHRDVGGFYFAYANSNAATDGLVTNAAATGYVQTQTGRINLNGYSIAGYWTHYGPTGWYLDAVLQGTFYDGEANTQATSLPTEGSGVATSLEAGYPIPLSFGPGFVLEPQLQIIWQHVSFDAKSDGLGRIDLGSTSGATGRIGVRGQWNIESGDDRLWQPYGRINLWHDWGGAVLTQFGNDQIPLLEQATRLEFAGGLTARLGLRFSVYLQAGYQFAVGDTDGGRRQGVQGDLGLRYTW